MILKKMFLGQLQNRNKIITKKLLAVILGLLFLILVSHLFYISQVRAAPCSGTTCLCGDTVVGDATLSDDLICPGNGLIIGGNNLTLNCVGYNITGMSSPGSTGIVADNISAINVIIRSCNVDQFETGISISSSSSSASVQILNNNITSVQDGITFNGRAISGTVLKVANNNITSNENGMLVADVISQVSNRSEISNNTINAGYDGINLDNVKYIDIINNPNITTGISSGTGLGGGIELVNVDYSNIENNVITYVGTNANFNAGLYLVNSDNNIVDSNQISQYSSYGIHVYRNNKSNKFLRNSVFQNNIGGIRLTEMPDDFRQSPDNRNVFYDNSIYNNGSLNLVVHSYFLNGYNQVFDIDTNTVNDEPLYYFYNNLLRHYNETTGVVTNEGPFNIVEQGFPPLTTYDPQSQLAHLTIAASNNMTVQNLTIDKRQNTNSDMRYTNDPINIRTSNNIILDTVTVQYNYSTAVRPGIDSSGFKNPGFWIYGIVSNVGVTLKDCLAYRNGASGLIIESSRNVNIEDSIIEENSLTDPYFNAIDLVDNRHEAQYYWVGGNIKLEGTKVINNNGHGIGFNNTYGGLNGVGVEEWIQIIGSPPTDPENSNDYDCQINNNRGGIIGTGFDMAYIRIQNCEINNNNQVFGGSTPDQYSGIQFYHGSGSGTDDLSHFEVLNNKITNNNYSGIYFLGGPNEFTFDNDFTDIKIEGNIIDGNGDFVDYNDKGGIYVNNAKRVDILNNTRISNNAWTGIYTVGTEDLNITGNSVENNNASGIHIESGSDGLIKLNSVRNNDSRGISLDGPVRFDITSNEVEDNFNSQIYMDNCQDNYLADNALKAETGEKVRARYLEVLGDSSDMFRHQIRQSNTANNKNIFYYYNNYLEGYTNDGYTGDGSAGVMPPTGGQTYSITSPDTQHVTIASSTNFTLSNYGPVSQADPVTLAYSTNSIIEGSYLQNCRGGNLDLMSGEGEGKCIHLYNADNNQILSNSLISSSHTGIKLEQADNNTIGGSATNENLISSNKIGISLYSNSQSTRNINNEISYNQIIDNGSATGQGAGIYFEQYNGSDDYNQANIIHHNTFNNAAYPLSYEVWLSNHESSGVKTNRFNDFYANNFQIAGALDEGVNNNWCDDWEVVNFNIFAGSAARPTDAANCGVPQVELYTTPVQRFTNRYYTVQERNNNSGLVDVWSKYADYEGNNLEALLQHGLNPDEDPAPSTKAVLSETVGDTSATIGNDPDVSNAEEYPLGVFSTQAIETVAWSSGTPTELEKNNVSFVWQAVNDLSNIEGTFRVSIKDRDIKLVDAWDRLRTESSLIEEFELDLLDPDINNFRLTVVDGNKYTFTWDAAIESNWSTAGAHYELWYGTVEAEVLARTGSAQVWEEICRLPPANCMDIQTDPDNGNYDPLMLNQNRNITTLVTSISPMYFMLCAVDDFGNEECLSLNQQPWIETKHGDVYSGQGVTGLPGTPPSNKYNATYLIAANGTVSDFKTESSGSEWLNQSYGQVPLPEEKGLIGLYFSKNTGQKEIGLIDVAGIKDGLYGQKVDASTLSSGPLDNKVYHSTGDLIISSDLQFDFDGGSGTVIVDGNLTINANITYETGWPTNLNDLASLAWIVFGDVNIDPSVTEIAGNFIVLGNGIACTNPSCGVVYSGSGGNQLNISGFMMARRFSFQRLYASPSQGSEVIVDDGRALANTPPGLEDINKALPRWE